MQLDADQPWIGARDWALVVLIFGCGLRISEALALRNRDVAARPATLRILGKGNKERVIYLNAACQGALEAWLAVRSRSGFAGGVRRIGKIHGIAAVWRGGR